MNNNVIGIIGAMDCEVNKLKELMTEKQEHEVGFVKVYTGKIHGHKVVLAKSGVGKASAAMCTQYMIDNYHPDFIINTGVAGGLASNLSIGDIVIGEKLVQHDFDASDLGYAKGYMCTGIKPKEPTVFYSDTELIEDFEKASKASGANLNIHRGIIATGDMFVGSLNKKKEIKEIFNASAAEMEGAAIAQCATANKVPFVIIRAISDLADGSACESLDKFETKMAELCSKTIAALLEQSVIA